MRSLAPQSNEVFLNCNSFLGDVADQNNIAIIDSCSLAGIFAVKQLNQWRIQDLPDEVVPTYFKVQMVKVTMLNGFRNYIQLIDMLGKTIVILNSVLCIYLFLSSQLGHISFSQCVSQPPLIIDLLTRLWH